MIEVVGGIIREEKKVILVKNRQGFWVLPGGKIDPGETQTLALQREINEELNGLYIPESEIIPYKTFGPLKSPIGEGIIIHTFDLPNVKSNQLSTSNEIKAIGEFDVMDAMALDNIKLATQMIILDLIFTPKFQQYGKDKSRTEAEQYIDFVSDAIKMLGLVDMKDL